MGPRLLAEELLDRADVRRRDRHLVVQPTGNAGRLVLVVVRAVGAPPHDLAAAGHPKPLSGPGVRLHLRHGRRRPPNWAASVTGAALTLAVRAPRGAPHHTVCPATAG